MSRDLGPHRYQPGDTIGRWTVVRHLAPVSRIRSGQEIRRRQLLVVCVCGAKYAVLERYIAEGDSNGCPLKTCMHAFKARVEIASWTSKLRDHVAGMSGMSDLDATEAHDRLAKAKARYDRLMPALDARRQWRDREP